MPTLNQNNRQFSEAVINVRAKQSCANEDEGQKLESVGTSESMVTELSTIKPSQNT